MFHWLFNPYFRLFKLMFKIISGGRNEKISLFSYNLLKTIFCQRSQVVNCQEGEDYLEIHNI